MSTALFGLPNSVKYCKTCVVSNQKAVSSNQYQDTINSTKKLYFLVKVVNAQLAYIKSKNEI